MKVTIDKQEIYIDKANWTIAQAVVNSFLEKVKTDTDKINSQALYFTVLLAMYQQSVESMNIVGVDNLKYVLNNFYEKSLEKV